MRRRALRLVKQRRVRVTERRQVRGTERRQVRGTERASRDRVVRAVLHRPPRERPIARKTLYCSDELKARKQANSRPSIFVTARSARFHRFDNAFKLIYYTL